MAECFLDSRAEKDPYVWHNPAKEDFGVMTRFPDAYRWMTMHDALECYYNWVYLNFKYHFCLYEGLPLESYWMCV